MSREEIMLWLEHLANRETDSQCVDYLENICKMFVNGSKNCEGQALEYQQKYISAIRHAIAKLQSSEVKERSFIVRKGEVIENE